MNADQSPDTKKVRAVHHDDPDPGTHTRTDTNQLQSNASTDSTASADVALRRGGFDKFEHHRAAVRDTGLSHADFRVLSVIWDHANTESMTAFPSRDTIAKHLGLSSPDNLKANIRRIVKAGYLEVVKAGSFDPKTKRNYSTVYRLTLPITPKDGGVTSTPPVGIESTPLVGVASTPLTDHAINHAKTTTTAPGAKGSQEDKVGVPQDWTPKPEHRDLSDSRGLNYTYELAEFRERNQNNFQRDWDATFTRWLNLARVPAKLTPKSSTTPRKPAKASTPAGSYASWMNLSPKRPQ